MTLDSAQPQAPLNTIKKFQILSDVDDFLSSSSRINVLASFKWNLTCITLNDTARTTLSTQWVIYCIRLTDKKKP